MKKYPLAALAALAVTTLPAHAQWADMANLPISVRIGVTQIRPSVESGNLSAASLPGTQSNIKAATSLSGGISWWMDDHVALDLPLALPFKHEVVGAGAIAGVGKLGTVKVLPATLFMQYHFGQASDPYRLFVGAGPTYAYFYDGQGSPTLSALTGVRGTSLKTQSKLTGSFEVGTTVRLNDKVDLEAVLAKTFLKTKATLSTGQTQDLRLDPWTVSLGVSYRF